MAEYRHQIGAWICDFDSDLPIVSSWLAIHSIDIEEYVTLLAQSGEVDRLEVWVASMALGCPLNVIFESVVWSTSVDSFNTAYQSLLMTSHYIAVLCKHALDPAEHVVTEDEAEDMSHLGAAAPVKRKGHPVTRTPEYPDRCKSDSNTTDTEQLFEAATLSKPPIVNAGKAISWQCLVYTVDLLSGVALHHHLQLDHPCDKPYTYYDCGSIYNNLKELSSHQSNVHWACSVSCSHCDYATTSKAKIHQYV